MSEPPAEAAVCAGESRRSLPGFGRFFSGVVIDSNSVRRLAVTSDQSLSRSHVIVVCTSPSLFFVTGGFRISLFPENSKNR